MSRFIALRYYRSDSKKHKFPSYSMGTISTTAALLCALRAIVNDSEGYKAMSRYICSATSLYIVYYRSLSLTIARNAQRSAGVVETGL